MPIHEVYTAPNLNDDEELCSECRGEGRVVWGHKFIGPPDYIDCHQCEGTGKTVKRPLCRVQDCKHKVKLTHKIFYNPSRMGQVCHESGFCAEHLDAQREIDKTIESANKELESLKVQAAAAEDKLSKAITEKLALEKGRV